MSNSNDYFWEIGVNVMGKADTEHIVMYRTSLNLDPDEVVMQAVDDGELHESFIDFVEYCLEITPEEYFEVMYE
jgi:hypothetical protein